MSRNLRTTDDILLQLSDHVFTSKTPYAFNFIDMELFLIAENPQTLFRISWPSGTLLQKTQLDSITSSVLSMSFVDDLGLCLITNNGGMYSCPTDSPNTITRIAEIEDYTILSVAWSPEGDFCAVSTSMPSIVLLSSSLELIQEIPIDSPAVEMEWRPDGQFLGVLCGSKEDLLQLNIFSRDFSSMKSSETLSMFPLLSWKSSELATVPLRSQNCLQIFEPNGLSHKTIPLFDISCVKGIVWNLNGDVLAVCTDEGVFMYVRENYEWYVKAEIRIFNENIVQVFWDPEHPISMICIGEKGTLRIVSYAWTVSRESNGAYASIAYKSCRLTHFDKAILPPPLSHEEIQFPAQPIECSLCYFKGETVLVTILSSGDLFINSNPIALPNSLEIYPRQLSIVSDDETLRICLIQGELGDEIVRIDVTRSSNDFTVQSMYSLKSPSKVFKITPNGYSNAFTVQSDNGEMFNFTSEGLLQTRSRLPLSSTIVYSKDLLVYTDEFDQLLVNDFVLSQQCSSFMISEDYLAFTVSGPQTLFYLINLTLPLKNITEMTPRPLERGALIMHMLPTSQQVVLLLPRGNLETFFPKLLLQTALDTAIQENPGKAVEICKRHRLPLEQLVDTPRALFSAMLESLSNLSMLSAFINVVPEETLSLLEDYVTLFKGSEAHLRLLIRLNQFSDVLDLIKENHSLIAFAGKLIGPLELYKISLERHDLVLSHTIATHIPEFLQERIPQIKRLGQLDVYRRTVEIEVYLGNHRKALEAYCSLPERTKEDDKSILDITQSHHLHEFALSLVKSTALRKEIVLSYGSYLIETSQRHEAGLLYLSEGLLDLAFSAFKSALSWKKAFEIGFRLGHDPFELASILSDTLRESSQLEHKLDASILLWEVLNDADEAVTAAVEGRDFERALFLTHCSGRDDLTATSIRPALLECVREWISALEDRTNTMLKRMVRLEEIAKGNLNCYDENELDDTVSELSAFTLASQSSMVSQSTVASQVSQAWSTKSLLLGDKTKKKRQSRRKNKVRPGDPEELPLILKEVKTLLPNASLFKEINALIQSLIVFGEKEIQWKLVDSFQSLVDTSESLVNLPIASSIDELTFSSTNWRFPGL